MTVTGENQSVRKKRLSQWHFVYNRSRINRDRVHISAMTGRRLTSRAMAKFLKHEFNVTNTECFRRNLRYFGRTFLRNVYIDITKHTYIWSWAVTGILMGEKCGLLVLPRTVPIEGVLSVHCPSAHFQPKGKSSHTDQNMLRYVTGTPRLFSWNQCEVFLLNVFISVRC